MNENPNQKESRKERIHKNIKNLNRFSNYRQLKSKRNLKRKMQERKKNREKLEFGIFGLDSSKSNLRKNSLNTGNKICLSSEGAKKRPYIKMGKGIQVVLNHKKKLKHKNKVFFGKKGVEK